MWRMIWASTQENLSSGVCEQHRRRPACAQASFCAVRSAPLLFAFWKESYVNLLQVKFQFSS